MQKIMNWIDARFPLTALWESQWGKYVAPKNFNFWYYFGSLAAFVLVLQIVTGIVLTMNYKPDASVAFARDKFQIALVGKNLANEVANLGDNRSIAAEVPGRPRLFVNQPRTLGVEFRQSF